jgi:hypothetical protein
MLQAWVVLPDPACKHGAYGAQQTKPRSSPTAQVVELLHVSPAADSRWAQEGRLTCLRTLSAHRRSPDQERRARIELTSWQQELIDLDPRPWPGGCFTRTRARC